MGRTTSSGSRSSSHCSNNCCTNSTCSSNKESTVIMTVLCLRHRRSQRVVMASPLWTWTCYLLLATCDLRLATCCNRQRCHRCCCCLLMEIIMCGAVAVSVAEPFAAFCSHSAWWFPFTNGQKRLPASKMEVNRMKEISKNYLQYKILYLSSFKYIFLT